MSRMPAESVVALLIRFEAEKISTWIDGGWAVDALLGEETRPHGDLDIVVQKHDLEHTCHLLQNMGYKDKVDEETKPWNVVMTDEAGHEIDFHVIEFDEKGNGVYGPPELGLSYPSDSLAGHGFISGCPVSCMSPEWLVRFHTGYEINERCTRCDGASQTVWSIAAGRIHGFQS